MQRATACVRCRTCGSIDCRGWPTSPSGRPHTKTFFWRPGAFAQVYADNQRTAIDDAIDADPVAFCVRELIAEHGSWCGSATELLAFASKHQPNIAWNDRLLGRKM